MSDEKQVEESMWDKISDKLKLGKHYRIERFGIFTSFLVGVLVICMVIGVKSQANDQNIAMTEVAQYTTEVTTSKTDISGEVVGVYSNKANTKAFVLLNFDDIDGLSTNADEYQMFLTHAKIKSNGNKLVSNPAGTIYVFGTSGYFGIYLVDNAGFAPQVVDLTIRANSEIVPSNSTTDIVSADESFVEFDQFKMFFNPGAKNTIKTAALEKDDFTIFDLYENIVVQKEETLIREELQSKLDDMRVGLNAIDEYRRTLVESDIEGDSIIVPPKPVQIAEDKIIVKKGKTIKDKETGEPLDEKYLDFKTDYVLAGGFDFDWYNGSVKKGYISKLKNPQQNNSQFLISKSKEELAEDSMVTDEIEWFLSSGIPWSEYADTDLRDANAINASIERLVSSYSRYYEHKREYQTNLLRKLLELEVSSRSVEDNYSVNTDPEVLLIY